MAMPVVTRVAASASPPSAIAHNDPNRVAPKTRMKTSWSRGSGNCSLPRGAPLSRSKKRISHSSVPATASSIAIVDWKELDRDVHDPVSIDVRGVHVESETDEQRFERCDHQGTTEPLNGLGDDLDVHALRQDLADALRPGCSDCACRVEARRLSARDPSRKRRFPPVRDLVCCRF
jgi:hypothetical protein